MIETILTNSNDELSFGNQYWEFCYKWLFLAQADNNSIFSELPVEVTFNFVKLAKNLPRSPPPTPPGVTTVPAAEEPPCVVI
jgi:hypothetical protein